MALAIDLSAPRFHTVAPFLHGLDAFPDHAVLNALAEKHSIHNITGLPLRFVQSVEGSYEQRIHEQGEVSTRPQSWHDLFNALAWCAFPRSKAMLNELHVAELARQKDARRSPARDVLTLFDESGMVVACAHPELAALLRNFEWKELFWRRREEVRLAMCFYVFGHALHEQLLEPYAGITGKAVIVDVDSAFFARDASSQLSAMDEALFTHFGTAPTLQSTRNLQPVPVLGIPDWWSQNEEEHYYDNTQYFRPGRAKK